ncbi:hypothetical protein [Vibrio sp. D431a]|uniref:hypothetical protein n=1 Tax=Vibrio sp. D431a TaxID=2837388 RepID=UPI0025526508|nr:hypothetical protein [Vibrio sp. D431a]MDK9789981.1 hypothetical protein [Vibrio sp. D431a]
MYKPEELQNVLRLLCRQICKWDKLRRLAIHNELEQSKVSLKEALADLTQPLSLKLLHQLSNLKVNDTSQQFQSIEATYLISASEKVVNRYAERKCRPMASIEGLVSLIEFFSSTLIDWHQQYNQAITIENHEDFKSFLFLHVSAIQGTKLGIMIRGIAEQSCDLETANTTIKALIN